MRNLTPKSNVSNLPSAPTLSPDVVIPSPETYLDEDADADEDEDEDGVEDADADEDADIY